MCTDNHFIYESCSDCPNSWRCQVYPAIAFDSIVNIFKMSTLSLNPSWELPGEFECQTVKAATRRGYRFSNAKNFDVLQSSQSVPRAVINIGDPRIPMKWGLDTGFGQDFEFIRRIFWGIPLIVFAPNIHVTMKNCDLRAIGAAHWSQHESNYTGEPFVTPDYVQIIGDII